MYNIEALDAAAQQLNLDLVRVGHKLQNGTIAEINKLSHENTWQLARPTTVKWPAITNVWWALQGGCVVPVWPACPVGFTSKECQASTGSRTAEAHSWPGCGLPVD